MLGWNENAVMPNGAAAAAAARIANAIRASGAIVHVESDEFAAILGRASDPLVVCTQGGMFSIKHQHLTAYKGLIFYTKARTPIPLPEGTEAFQAKRI